VGVRVLERCSCAQAREQRQDHQHGEARPRLGLMADSVKAAVGGA
jgi:hypothetical protein